MTLPNEIHISRQDGILVNILDFTAEEMPIEEIAHNLSQINRYGGAQPRPVSVALHSLLVSYMVPGSLAYEALMHDASEALVGDVMHPIKAECPDFRAIEAAVHRNLAREYRLPLIESPRVKAADLQARVFECGCRRAEIFVATVYELSLCNFLLGPDYTPGQVVEMFLARYEATRTLSLN